jgi:hypothetical protein
MKHAAALFTSVGLLLALAPEARADEASQIAAAAAWWKETADWAPPKVSKKAPVQYAITSTIPKCKKLKAGKAANKKQAEALSQCLSNAYLGLIPAEIDFTPTEEGWSVTSEPWEMLFGKKQQKPIRAASKGTTVISNVFWGPGEATEDRSMVQVFVAVDARDQVRGVFVIASD